MDTPIKDLLTDLQAVLVKHNAYIGADADAADDTSLTSWLEVGIYGERRLGKDLHYFKTEFEPVWDDHELDNILKDSD